MAIEDTGVAGDPRRRRSTSEARREQLLESSARLFYLHGYQQVSVADVARTLGMTAGAIYRHVPDKQGLLVESVREMVVAWSDAARDAVGGDPSPEDALTRLIAATVDIALDRADVVGLWHRESGVIPVQVRQELVAIRRTTITTWSDVLSTLHPGRSPGAIDFQIRSVLGLLNSAPQLQSVSRKRLAAQLASMMASTLSAPVALDATPARRSAELPRDPADKDGSDVPRSEVILRAAARLFRERGYGVVGIDEVGSAANIAGPSIYKHFDSKVDLLAALLTRISDDLVRNAEAAVAQCGPAPDEILQAFVRSHIETAFQSRDLVATYITEAHHLPPPMRREMDRRSTAYRRQWTTCLVQARPKVSAVEARVACASVIAMIDAVARSDRFAQGPQLVDATMDLAMAALPD